MKFNQDQSKVTEIAKAIRLLLLDVDGVLTDGTLIYSEQGELLKVFNTLDGHGLKMLQSAGVDVGIVSGRDSEALQRRVTDLGIELVYKGREDKLTVVKEIAEKHEIPATEIAYAGDDLPDLAAIEFAGLGIAVPNAHDEVRKIAQIETNSTGGSGAVREVCDFILEAKGLYANLIDKYRMK